MQTLAVAGQVGTYAAPVNLVAFSPDGAFMATSDIDRRVMVWRGEEPVYELDLHTDDHRIRPLDFVRSMCFSYDGQTVYVASGDVLRKINVYTGQEEWARQAGPNMVFLLTTPTGLARSASGRVACAYADGHVEYYSAEGELERSWEHKVAPFLVGFLSGERMVGTDRFGVTIWDADGKLLEQRKPVRRIFAIASSPDNDLLAVRSLHEVLIIRTSDWMVLSTSGTRPGYPVLHFAAPDRLVSLDVDGFSVLDEFCSEVARVDTPGYRPIGIASHRERGLAVSGSDGLVHFYQLDTSPIPPPVL